MYDSDNKVYLLSLFFCLHIHRSTGFYLRIGYNEDNKSREGMKDGVGLQYLFLDIIWLDNLIVNFIVLWITWKLSRNTSPMWRLWCSACIGAVYAVFLIMPGFTWLGRLPLKIMLSLVMLAAGFSIQSLQAFLKLFGYFYGVTFILGGAAFGFYYFFGTGIQVFNGIFIINGFPIKIVLFSIVFILLLYRWLWPFLRFRINRQQLVYQVEFKLAKTKFHWML